MEFLKDVFKTEALIYDQLAEKLKDNKPGNITGGIENAKREEVWRVYVASIRFVWYDLPRGG